MFKNNKGFSLIEVLVTVGLIGVLVSIAVPAYNKYKTGTNLMAMKADLGNASKTYIAHDAVNDTFCASFKDVGFSINSASPVWARNAFIGFAATDGTDCNTPVTASPDYTNGIQYESGAVPFTITANDMSACTNMGGTWTTVGTVGTCTGGAAYEFKGTPPAACVLGSNKFTMGASSETAGTAEPGGNIVKLFQIKDTGEISEQATDCVP